MYRQFLIGAVAAAALLVPMPANAADQPNIVVIMGDDIGIWNIGAYNRGLMAGHTPNSTRSRPAA